MGLNFFYLSGGGLGDVYREAIHNGALGILRRWKILHPSEELEVVLMTHNSAPVDLLNCEGLEVQRFQFPEDTEKSWEVFYERYLPQFVGSTEIRFHITNDKSTFHRRFDHLRTNPGALLWIDPCGCEVKVHGEDRNLTSKLILHPGAGEEARCLTPDVIDMVMPHRPLVIGANYPRRNHPEETGLTLPPRDLVQTIRNSHGVVGSESSVAYIASMVGVPFCMLYREGQTFDLVQRGISDWDWYYGLGILGNLYLKCPLDEEGRAKFSTWLERFRTSL